MITGKLGSYAAAQRQVMPEVEHRSHKGLNNRAENSHLPFRRRERVMQGIRSPRYLQRFISVFSAVRNLFVSSHSHRFASATHLHRLNAMAEWNRVVVAMLVGKDPAVDQPWQDGLGVEPVDRAPPVAEKAKRLFPCGGGHHLEASLAEHQGEAALKVGIDRDDQDTLARRAVCGLSPKGGAADIRLVQSGQLITRIRELTMDCGTVHCGFPLVHLAPQKRAARHRTEARAHRRSVIVEG
jgi:hypothetical protein